MASNTSRSDPAHPVDLGREEPGAVRALVSVHDLMPQTMPAVRRTLDLLERRRIAPVTLLVVPGADWDRAGIAALRGLQRAGYRLAGHGWRHHCERITRPYHRLHSLLLSRRVAEHLALDAAGIIALINRGHAWFAEHDLAVSGLYVPPAWALGAISPAQLAAACPYAQYEVFRGLLHAASGRLKPVPMLGYEADNGLRVPVIRAWNALNRRRARASGWVRIGIHPHDLGLRLGADLIADLARYPLVADYPEANNAGV